MLISRDANAKANALTLRVASPLALRTRSVMEIDGAVFSDIGPRLG